VLVYIDIDVLYSIGVTIGNSKGMQLVCCQAVQVQPAGQKSGIEDGYHVM
jgi:hypothetical protein